MSCSYEETARYPTSLPACTFSSRTVEPKPTSWVNDAQFVQSAPYTTPVRRLDEAAAARNPVVKQDLDALAYRRVQFAGPRAGRPMPCGRIAA